MRIIYRIVAFLGVQVMRLVVRFGRLDDFRRADLISIIAEYEDKTR